MTPQSSAYSESSIGTEWTPLRLPPVGIHVPPCFEDLPLIWKSFFVLKTHAWLLGCFFLKDIMIPQMYNTNKIGPRMSPCFTPINESMTNFTSWHVNSTVTSVWSTFSKRSSFGGTPSLPKTFHKNDLGTRSNALTKSKNSTHVSAPCSCRFRKA